MFEGRQAQFPGDPDDVCLVHTPRLNFTSYKLCTSKALCAPWQRLSVDEFDLSIIRLNLSDELSELSFDTGITRL